MKNQEFLKFDEKSKFHLSLNTRNFPNNKRIPIIFCALESSSFDVFDVTNNFGDGSEKVPQISNGSGQNPRKSRNSGNLSEKSRIS